MKCLCLGIISIYFSFFIWIHYVGVKHFITKLTTFFASSTLYHMPIFHRSLFKFMRSDVVGMTTLLTWFKFLFCKITSSSVLMDDILSWLTQQNHTRSITGERMYQACRQVSVKTITHLPCIGNIMIIITEMP